ncbi:MAG: hypothetical protein IT195_12570 [Microthrixaceae bacterium]|nr:hypothetical protein [Microthrixaceae bacterium]
MERRQYNLALRMGDRHTVPLYKEDHPFTREELEEIVADGEGRILLITREVTPWLVVASES